MPTNPNTTNAATTTTRQLISPSKCNIEMKRCPINNTFKIMARNLQFDSKKYDKWKAEQV